MSECTLEGFCSGVFGYVGALFVQVFNGLTKERKFIIVFIALDLSVGVFSGRSCRRQALK